MAAGELQLHPTVEWVGAGDAPTPTRLRSLDLPTL